MQKSFSLQYKFFPAHKNKERFSYYNLYRRQGIIQTKNIIRMPIVGNKCTTQCYIDIDDYTQQYKKCNICGQSIEEYILDLGYKRILMIFCEMIRKRKPLKVQLKPSTKQFYLSFQMKNSPLSYIADRFGQVLIKDIIQKNKLPKKINYQKLQTLVKNLFEPYRQKTQQIQIFSWCRLPKSLKNPTTNPQILFFYDNEQPIKVSIEIVSSMIKQTEYNDQQILKIYYQNGMMTYLSENKIMVLSIAFKHYSLFYANKLSLSKQTSKIIFKNFYKEKKCRRFMCLHANQRQNTIYVFGGFSDSSSVQSPSNILILKNIDWDEDEGKFQCQPNENHQLFPQVYGGRLTGLNHRGEKDKKYRQTLRAATAIRFQSNFKYKYQKQQYISNMLKDYPPFNKKQHWVVIGGCFKQISGIASNKVFTCRPGFKDIQRDLMEQTASISQQAGRSDQINFAGLYPFCLQVPITGQSYDKDFLNKILVFGITQRKPCAKVQEQQRNKVYQLDIRTIQIKVIRDADQTDYKDSLVLKHEDESFRTANFPSYDIAYTADNMGTLVFDQQKEFYLTMTLPLNPQRDIQYHYMIVNFYLKTGKFQMQTFRKKIV